MAERHAGGELRSRLAADCDTRAEIGRALIRQHQLDGLAQLRIVARQQRDERHTLGGRSFERRLVQRSDLLVAGGSQAVAELRKRTRLTIAEYLACDEILAGDRNVRRERSPVVDSPFGRTSR